MRMSPRRVARSGVESDQRAGCPRYGAWHHGVRAFRQRRPEVTSGGTGFHRNVIIRLAAQLRLPSVYPYRYYANEGGLAAYGPNTIEQYRRAARYVDRILKGEKPADLPVQAPTKYETGGQSQNRQGARHERAISAARPRRRGDRIRGFCCGA